MSAEPRIFVSYRRADAAATVAHLCERLGARYGRRSIFRDIDKIPLGRNFVEHIREELSSCDVVLIIIGPRWLAVDDRSHSRLREDADPVRLEIEGALASRATVIPVLVEDAPMPRAADLPPSLEGLLPLAGTRVSVEDFDGHVARLLAAIDDTLSRRGKYVAAFPRWGVRAAMVSGLAALAALAALAVLSRAGATPPPLVPFGLVAIAGLGVAGAAAFACGHAAARRRIRVGPCCRYPRAFSAAVAVVVLAVAALAGTWFNPFAGQSDPIVIANRLRAEFVAARDMPGRTGPADFTAAAAMVDALKRLDPASGHAWYFAGEIRRVGTPGLFTGKSCFTGASAGTPATLDIYQQDFHRYLDTALGLPATEIGSDPAADTCYSRPKGYCVQRTAWINHLLANDFYEQARSLSGSDRIQALTRAREYAAEAGKFRPPVGGIGFDQCIPTPALIQRIDDELRNPAATGSR
jgi:hypothetical protein